MRSRFVALAAAAAAVILPTAAAHAQPADLATKACDWPMFGHTALRTFASTCPHAPNASNVATLHPRWVLHTSDVVTAQPAVVGGTVYAGDWDGTFYAVDQSSGAVRWQTVLGNNAAAPWTDAHHDDYGQITSSAAVATVGGTPTVYVGAAASLYALDAGSGTVLWRFDTDPAQPTGVGEVESSPVVWAQNTPNGDPWILFGADANQSSDFPGEGLWAVDALTHQAAWHFNPEAYTGKPLYGCGNVWSSPALDVDPGNPDPARRAMVFFGTADCPDNGSVPCPSDGTDPHCPAGATYDYAQRWQPYAEAVIGLDARTGLPQWSYQPHVAGNTDDDDFGSSAQVFTLPGPHGGHRVVGEGNKDGSYMVVDRDTGALVWRSVEQGNGNVTAGQAVGGFIGNTAVAATGSPSVFGGSAIDTPFTDDPATGAPVPQGDPTAGLTPMRAFSAVDGTPSWQAVQGPSYGATTWANGVVYNGALDGLLRAYDPATGRLLWAFPLGAPISSGAAVAGNDVAIGAGTSDTDAEFKACDPLVGTPLYQPCHGAPLDQQLNPLSRTGEIWDFTLQPALLAVPPAAAPSAASAVAASPPASSSKGPSGPTLPSTAPSHATAWSPVSARTSAADPWGVPAVVALALFATVLLTLQRRRA